MARHTPLAPRPGRSGEPSQQEIWRFGAFILNCDRVELQRDGTAIALSPLLVALLAELVRRHGRVVTRDELVASAWRGVTVGEGSLRQAMWELRQKLGESAGARAMIETVRGRGYRFVAPVQRAGAPASGTFRAASQASSADASPAAAPLFGRADQIERLAQLLARARHEGGRACAIVGSAGVGKSRLAREIVPASAADGSFVEGHADADRMAPAFWPWLQIVSSYLDARPASAELQRTRAPAVFRLLSGHTPPAPLQHPEASRQQRFALLAELAKLLVALTRESPGVLLFEDLQWADEASLALLTHVLPMLARTRSLLVVTCRTPRAREDRHLARALQQIARTPWSERIELENLAAHDVASMLAAHSQQPVPASLSAQVFEVSRGNPLFANELSHLLARAQPAQLELTEIRAVIRRRLEALPESAYLVAVSAAVLSPEFSVAELASAADASPADVLTGVDQCVAHEVLVELPDGRFAFAHPLLRECAYASLPLQQRCTLHLRAGEWLEAHAVSARGTRLSELARHFNAALPLGCTRKVVRYAAECAAFAYASTAFADAQFYYQQALNSALQDKTVTAEEILNLELLMAEARRALGVDHEGLNRQFLELVQRAEALHNPALQARAVLGYCGQHSMRFVPTRFPAGLHDDQIALIERALAALGPEPSELRALLLCSLSSALLYSTKRARREESAREARTIAASLGVPWLAARALMISAYTCAAPDARQERVALCDELVALTREHGLEAQEADAILTRVSARLNLGVLDGADEEIARARYLAGRVELPRLRTRCDLLALWRAFWRGDLQAARAYTEAALAAHPEDLLEQAFFMVRMAALEMLQHGLRPQTLRFHESMLSEHPGVLGIHAVLASIYATQGDFGAARRHFDLAAQDDFRGLPEDLALLSELTSLADAARRLGDGARAQAVYERLAPHAHIFDILAAEAVPAGCLAYWLAQLAFVFEDFDAAERWLTLADRVHQRLGAALFDQFTKVARARLLLRKYRSAPAARDLLREVYAFAERNDIALLRSEADDVEQECAHAPLRAARSR